MTNQKTKKENNATAVTAGDKAHYLLPAMERKVDRALKVISEASDIGRLGVAFSGGKDSTVLLDLVHRVVPNAAVAHYDSGAEYQFTYEMIEASKAITIKPKHDLIWMCKYGGYWWHENPVDYDTDFDFDEILVHEPARRFVKEHKLNVVAIGLRGQESYGRRMNARAKGELYQLKSGLFHLCPLAHWTDSDIWAYIAGRKLQYNRVYDKFAELEIPRKEWRVSCILGMVGASRGWRFAFLRQIEPHRFNELAAEFPMIKQFC